MLFKAAAKSVVLGTSHTWLGLNHDIDIGQGGPPMPETLADGPFDPVAVYRGRHRFLGYRKPQAGAAFSADRVNIETGIRKPEALAKHAGEFYRGMQPGVGWKPGSGTA